MSLRSWKYGGCKQAHPILQANEILYASQNLQEIVKILVSPTVAVLIHTCKRELSPAHLVCPWRHNA
jgi:hypothetical protein